MEQNQNNEDSKRNPTEQSEVTDNRYYRRVNHLGITRGPWEILSKGFSHNSKPSCIRSDEFPNIICNFSGLSNVRKKENAKLISAAPEMYEAIYEVLNQKHELDNYVMELCRNALKKAGG